MTFTGATIYSSRVVKTANSINLDDFNNFPQIALIFIYLSHTCSFFWINKKLIYSLNKKESYWINDAFKVFIDDWECAIYNLPKTYNRTLKKSTILKHSKKTNLFSTQFLYKMRSIGKYNRYILRKNKKSLEEHTNKSYLLLYIISLTPLWIIHFLSLLNATMKSIKNIRG